jgi:riboflavin synthase
MFTGIIESTAKILKLTESGMVLERPKIFDDLKIGCSIAVSGVCLTVTKFDEASMSFDVVPTTFLKTKFRTLEEGDSVNLERAMPANGRYEGHIVLGHAEGTGMVKAIGSGLLTLLIPDHLCPYVVLHGCIMIDGVALTVAELHGTDVTIAIIPHTLKLTTLSSLLPGDAVNLETDVLAKYIQKAHDAQ